MKYKNILSTNQNVLDNQDIDSGIKILRSRKINV